MILHIKDVKEICSKIKTALDSSEITTVTETRELMADGDTLLINITNKQYYAQCRVKLNAPATLRATVNASTFLKLMSMITTETVEIYTTEKTLMIKGNGEYTMPMIFEDDGLVELPKIRVETVEKTFDTPSEIFNSIIQNNLFKIGNPKKPVHGMYYIDNNGAITFTSSSACVNAFSLPEDIKFIIPQKIGKLFKLFSGLVHIKYGHTTRKDGLSQPQIMFETETFMLAANLNVDEGTLLTAVPSSAIRDRVNKSYPYVVEINKDMLSQAINRLSVFSGDFGYLDFTCNSVTVYDDSRKNYESLIYQSPSTGFSVGDTYSVKFNLSFYKTMLDSTSESVVSMTFGDHQAVVTTCGAVNHLITEIH